MNLPSLFFNVTRQPSVQMSRRHQTKNQSSSNAHSPLNRTQNSRLHQRPYVVGILGRILVFTARAPGSIAAAKEAVLDSAVGGEVEEFGL